MEQKRHTTETEKLLALAPEDIGLEPNYLDDDLFIIDNAKWLTNPPTCRPNLNIIAICLSGKLQMLLNGSPIELQKNTVFICPPNTTFSDVMTSPDFEYMALAITSQALQTYLHSYIEIWNQAIYVSKTYVYSMVEGDLAFYQKFYDLVKLCLNPPIGRQTSWSPYRGDVVKGLIGTGMLGLCNFLQLKQATPTATLQQSVSIFNRFLNLLQNSKVKHQTVEHYATELCISTKYLTVISKKSSGKTANDWIREYTLSDIIYYLRNTTLSIKEISNKTGFPNTSFFGKYVKEHLGCTPIEYRNQNKIQTE
jgi:AraC-like DNA-binding protein